MSILKQVIHYPDTNSVEATWVDRTITPQTEVPAVLDEEGSITTPAYTPEDVITDLVIRCHSYADVQMDMFRSDIASYGGDVSEYETLIATVEANIQPPPVIPLDDLKLTKWNAVKIKRDAYEQSGFPYLGHPIDSDPIAVQRIAIATQAAQAATAAGQPFLVEWKCQDDHLLPLDLAGMFGMAAALAMYANGLHSYARSLKELITSAVNQTSLDAIDIDTGWPV
jgi:hypothetical protein